MLVLTRRVGEEIVIGEVIRVKIVSQDGNKFRIGVEAPRDINVVRAELVDPQPVYVPKKKES
jgi:carbon storage regulator